MVSPILTAVAFAVLSACTPQGDPAIGSSGFSDDFNRDQIGEVWNNTGGPYAIKNGELHVRGAKNRPLWLRRTLPRDARIEFDVRSESEEGDIKVEAFGDGQSKAEADSYTATSYVVIFGGWNNSKNIIARMDEHGDDVAVGPQMKVTPGKTYHVEIVRQGDTVSVSLDGKPFMKLIDQDPLEGRGHDHFAFNNWASDLYFDNLKIEPL